MRKRPHAWSWLVAVFLLIAGTQPILAQAQNGNLYGTVRDSSGALLPGVTLTLSGVGATQVTQSDAQGGYHFLSLASGVWKVRAELEGFGTVDRENIAIAIGKNTTVDFALDPAITEIVVIKGEAPLLDSHRDGTVFNFGKTELEQLPNARDPWDVIRQAPGVLMDRVNVGGNESGQQPMYVNPGTNRNNSVWAVDGVAITDMGAIGSSPSYYNFDSFEEMQVSTGGSDASLATGGVTMNMVTKRGSNEWRFSARYLKEDDSQQSDLSFDRKELGSAGPWNDDTAQPRFQQGNEIVDIKDYGLEGGGPLVADRLWIWGSYGVQDIDLLTLAGVRGSTGPGSHDKTKIESYAAKINAQLGANNSLTAFYHYGTKEKSGRNASPTRPAPTTWNQKGPTPIYKLEDLHTFGSSFYLTGMASYVGGGFSLEPIGGGVGDPSFPNVVRGPDRVWRHSFIGFETDRPQRQAKLDGNYFFPLGTASSELRFGVGYRYAEVKSFSTWPGQQLVGRADIRLGPNTYQGRNRTTRDVSDEIRYDSAYVQDTVTLGNLVANLGLRYDRQKGHNNASEIPAAPVPFRDSRGNVISSGGNFAGGDPGFTWSDLTPRLGLTYALGRDKKTLLRLSYSRFADQLDSATVGVTNPTNYQYGYFLWQDRNGDLELTSDEVGPYFAFSGIDPANPGLHSISATDRQLSAPRTDELIASVEHALLPELVVGLSATYRQYSNIIENERLILDADTPATGPGSIGRPHQRSDYVLSHRLRGTLPSGQAFDVPIYTLASGRTYNGGIFQTNGDREQEYLGLSLTVNKRLANRWLMRGHVTWSDWTWQVPDSEREDPTQLLPGNYVDGGAVLVAAGAGSGAKADVFINSRWSVDISGLYQIAPSRPWGFNVSANLNARQGYPLPYNVTVDPGDAISTRSVLVAGSVDDQRNDSTLVANARVEKELHFGDWNLTLSLDGFNLGNESTVLQRDTNLNATLVDLRTGEEENLGNASGNHVREILSPRVFRLGARISFR
ncbi:MAG TPA: carboxypeptidase regulatory-like domain-containing protein [Thermoanaerobaculia bacterium]|nr:carboxypeptidase regulatory-like domain-containing protein [Thermoanaerobaculia bacterium]